MKSPYQHIFALQRNRRSALVPILIAVSMTASGWISQGSVFKFLNSPPIHNGLSGLLFRLTALSIAVLSITVYSRLMRSRDREVLSIHPIDPQSFLRALMMDTIHRSIWLPIGLIGFLTPLFFVSSSYFYISVVLILSSCLGGIGIAFAVTLGAVWVSTAPVAQPILDALRGPNPRVQAAFIYAPGFTLLMMGLLLGLSVEGGLLVIQRHLFYGAFLLLPGAIGLLGCGLALKLAPGQLVRATAILHEIDAHWVSVDSEGQGHEQHVYLDWMAKHSPERLRTLRQGWRMRRSLAIGPWICGALGALSAWSSNGEASVMFVNLGVAIGALLSGSCRDGDPLWLDYAIGVNRTKVLRARFEVGILYSAGAIIPVALVGLIGSGIPHMALLLCLAFAFCSASLSTFLGAKTKGPILPSYGIGVIVLWSILQGVS
ncbi:MAG: hypothetical protein VXZ96_11490 [Myxococcota bacterium]|nr:hypothetical protein [Myxococcota bacterium]